MSDQSKSESGNNKPDGHGKEPDFFFDNEPQHWPEDKITGKQLREKFSVPATVQIYQRIPGQKDREILDTTVVDLRGKGPERFSTQAVGSGAGLETIVQQLLLDEDYQALDDRGLNWEQDVNKRYLVLRRFPLPLGVYTVAEVDVLVQIPSTYNRDGIDMLWVSPRLTRVDGKPVPAQAEHGSGNNLTHAGSEFCRWSRHWQETYNKWRDGIDAIETILRRLDWAFAHPDANQA